MDLTKLRNKIKETNVDEDGYWQSILNIGYVEWQNRPKEDNWSYGDMIDWVRENYGDFAAFAILLGKYNQQVCNGGHLQYYDNGYASNGGGCFTNHGDDVRLHEELTDGMKEFGLDKLNNLSKEVFDILRSFDVKLDTEMYTNESCGECNGCGYVDNPDFDYDDEDSDEEETITCDCCGGSGYEEVSNENYQRPYNTDEWGELDDRYYKVNDEWEEWFENYVKDLLK